MKRCAWLLLALLLLCGCAAPAAQTDFAGVGRYPGTAICLDGGDWQPMSAVYAGENYLELLAGGTGTLCLDGEPFSIDWSLSAAELTLTAAQQSCRGTLSGGCAEISFFGADLLLRFGGDVPAAAPEPAAPAAELDTPSPELDASAPDATTALPEDYWPGDWYGWYAIVDTCEALSDFKDSAWDACARITCSDGVGTLSLWDTETDPGDTVCRAALTFSDGLTPAGTMSAHSGSFLDFALDGSWTCEPAVSDVSAFDHLICLSGRAVDPASGNWLQLRIYLRPWGMDWSDVKSGDLSGCWYEDMLPPGYQRWYAPLLKRGVTVMPDSFAAGKALLN